MLKRAPYRVSPVVPHVIWAELPYYIFAGLLWIIPVRFVLVWMAKPSRSDDS